MMKLMVLGVESARIKSPLLKCVPPQPPGSHAPQFRISDSHYTFAHELDDAFPARKIKAANSAETLSGNHD